MTVDASLLPILAAMAGIGAFIYLVVFGSRSLMDLIQGRRRLARGDYRRTHRQRLTYLSKATEQLELVDKLWSREEYSILFHSFTNPEPGEFEEIVNYNAVRAIAALTNFFIPTGIKYQLISSRQADIDLTANLVLVGSSASNRITDRLEGEYQSVFRYRCCFDKTSLSDRHFIDNIKGTRYSSEFNGAALVKDCGVVTKVPNPFNPDADIVMLTGNYGFGTLGAALLSVNGELLKTIDRHMDLTKPSQIVCSIPVFGSFVSGQPTISAFGNLSVSGVAPPSA